MSQDSTILNVARGVYLGALVLALFAFGFDQDLADLFNSNPLTALLVFALVVVPAPLLFKGIEDVDPHFTLG